MEKSKRDQILKLITKGFFNELINYGVDNHEIVTISANLLGELIQFKNGNTNQALYSSKFRKDLVEDGWDKYKILGLEGIEIRPLNIDLLDQMVDWLKDPAIEESFISLFPRTENQLKD